jgi:biotin carboxyl carrier protein
MTRLITLRIEGREYTVEVGDLEARPIKATVNGRTVLVDIPVSNKKFETTEGVPLAQAAVPDDSSLTAITAPMPGDIADLQVSAGDRVEQGDIICVLEAMKMKNLVHSPRAGTIATVAVSTGQSVDHGAVLVTFE